MGEFISFRISKSFYLLIYIIWVVTEAQTVETKPSWLLYLVSLVGLDASQILSRSHRALISASELHVHFHCPVKYRSESPPWNVRSEGQPP